MQQGGDTHTFICPRHEGQSWRGTLIEFFINGVSAREISPEQRGFSAVGLYSCKGCGIERGPVGDNEFEKLLNEGLAIGSQGSEKLG